MHQSYVNVNMINSNSQQNSINDQQFLKQQEESFHQVNNKQTLQMNSFNKQLICSLHKLPIEFIVLCTNYSYHYQNCCRKCLHQYKPNNELCYGYCKSCKFCKQMNQNNQIQNEQQQFTIHFEIEEILIDYTFSFKKLIKTFEKALRLIKMVMLKLNYNSLKRDSMLSLQKLYNNLKNISIEHMTLMGIDVKQFQKDLESNSSEYSYQRNSISFESLHKCMNFLLNEQKQWEEQERTLDRFITNQFDGYQNKRKRHLSEENFDYNEDLVQQQIDFSNQIEDINSYECNNNQNRKLLKKNFQIDNQFVSNLIQQNQTQSTIKYNDQRIEKQDQTFSMQENINKNIDSQQIQSQQNQFKSLEQRKEITKQNNINTQYRNVEEVLKSQCTLDAQTNKYHNPLLDDYSFNDIFNIHFFSFFNLNPYNWSKKYQQLEEFNSKEVELIHDLHNQIKLLFLERFDRVKYSLISQNKNQMQQIKRNCSISNRQNESSSHSIIKKSDKNNDKINHQLISQNSNFFDFNNSSISESSLVDINCQKEEQPFKNDKLLTQTATIYQKGSDNTFLFQKLNEMECNNTLNQDNIIFNDFEKKQQYQYESTIQLKNSCDKQQKQYHQKQEQTNDILKTHSSGSKNKLFKQNQEFDENMIQHKDKISDQIHYVQQEKKIKQIQFENEDSDKEQGSLSNDECKELFIQVSKKNQQEQFNLKNLQKNHSEEKSKLLQTSLNQKQQFYNRGSNNDFNSVEISTFLNKQISDMKKQESTQQSLNLDDEDFNNSSLSSNQLINQSSESSIKIERNKEKFNLQNLQCKDIGDVELVHHGKLFKFSNISYFDFNERYGIFYSMTEICQMYLFDFEQKKVDQQILNTQISQKEHNQIIIVKVSSTEIAVWQEEKFYEIIIFNVYSKKFYKFRLASIESFQLDESGQNEAEINLFSIFPGSTIGIQLNNKIIMVNYKSKKITRVYQLQVQKQNPSMHILQYLQQNTMRSLSQVTQNPNQTYNRESQQQNNQNISNITPISVINISSPSSLLNNPTHYHSLNPPFSSNILNIQPHSNMLNAHHISSNSYNNYFSSNNNDNQENQNFFNTQPYSFNLVSQSEIEVNRTQNYDRENEDEIESVYQAHSFEEDQEQEDMIEQFEDFKVVVNKINNGIEKCAHFNSIPQNDCSICQKNLKIDSVPRFYLYMRSDQSIWRMNLHNGQINEWQQTDNSQVVQQRFFPINENKWFYYKDTVDEQWIIVYNNYLQQGEYLSLKMMEFQSPILNKYWPLLNVDNQLQFFDYQKEQFHHRVFDPAGLVSKYSQNLREMIEINFPEQPKLEEFDKIDNYSFVKTNGKYLVFILSEGDIYYIK